MEFLAKSEESETNREEQTKDVCSAQLFYFEQKYQKEIEGVNIKVKVTVGGGPAPGDEAGLHCREAGGVHKLV